MTALKLAVLLLLSAIFEGDGLCVDRYALFNVTAVVRDSRYDAGLKVNDNFNFLENFAIIDVYRANVTDLCEGMIKDFRILKELYLISVNLSNIQPNAFQKLPKLKQLSLAVNELVKIAKGVFNNLPALETLYLSANRISSIEENAFANLVNLKTVHLDRNEIVELEGNLFRGCPQIRLLDFRFNRIEKISKGAFEDIRPNNTHPISILLNNNLISQIDAQAFDMLSPVYLNLRGNRISEMSDVFFSLKEKSQLVLNDNRISCVPDDVLEDMRDTTKDLYVLKNPLDCDCLDRIEKVMGETAYGKGQIFYSSIFPCGFVSGVKFD